MTFLVHGTAAAVQRSLTPAPERAPIADPVDWTRERTAIMPWSVQREIMRKVAETDPDAPRRIGVPSGHGVGKTWLAAQIAAWWVDGASSPGKRVVITSAPTGDQVKTLLWKEIKRTHYAASLPGNITGLTSSSGPVQWHIGQELVGLGRKPADLVNDTEAMQAFQGMHAEEGVLVILDEACGIPDWLWKAALSLLTNDASRILAIGNPDDPSSTFAEYTKPGSTWWVRNVSVFESPNFTGEPVSDKARASLTGPSWVRDAEHDYGGTDNPLYISKVLGRWPDISDDLVIQPRMIRRAWELDLPGQERGAFGLDVARSPTGAESALYRNRGGVIRRIDSWRGLPITAAEGDDSLCNRVYGYCSPTPAVPIVVDADGLGGAAVDGLRAYGKKPGEWTLQVAAFTAGGSPRANHPSKLSFDTRRSELWWDARMALENGEWDLDEADDVLAAQLQTPKFWQVRGHIHVETKKELAKRGKKSPDRADAAIMAAFGAPMDLVGTGDLGARAPAKPRPPGRVPRSLRVSRGDVAAVRDRPM